MLVFSQYNEAESPLTLLKAKVDNTTKSVTISTIIIIGGMIGLVCLLIVALVWYITSPLDGMIAISKMIVKIAAEDDMKRDYTPCVTNAFFNQTRSDEIGILATNYFNVVQLLHNKTEEKKRKPKYPKNPFVVNGVRNFSEFSWAQFWNQMDATLGISKVRIYSHLASGQHL